MPDAKKPVGLELWILKRPAMTALCLNNAQMYAVMQLAINEDWTPEHFLEYAVMLMGRINGGLVNDFLDYRMKNPEPIVIGTETYRYTHPEEPHGRKSDSPRPLRREGLR